MTQTIPLAGVIGFEASASALPRLMGHWLARTGTRGHYIPMEVGREHLRDVVMTLPHMGFSGVNVAQPHKETVLGIADLVTDRAALIGAANTLIFRKDGKIHADNTEGFGFIANLREAAPHWDPRNSFAAVLGAGSTARAVVASLIEVGVPEIRLCNRSRARAEALRADFGAKVTVYEWVQAGNMIEEAGIVVNTTPLGQVDQPEFRVPLDGLAPQMAVADVSVGAADTRLMAEARAMGCAVADGAGMLQHQLIPVFERWFGLRPEITDQSRVAVQRV